MKTHYFYEQKAQFKNNFNETYLFYHEKFIGYFNNNYNEKIIIFINNNHIIFEE